MVAVDMTQVQSQRNSGGVNLSGFFVGFDGQRIEPSIVHNFEARSFQLGCQRGGFCVDRCRDGLQAFRAVIDCVHAGHNRQQHLCGTDV